VKLSTSEPRWQEAEALLSAAERSLLLSSAECALLLVILAASGAVYTKLDERAAAYVILGLAVIIHNRNSLRISSLLVDGDPDSLLVDFQPATVVMLESKDGVWMLRGTFTP